MSALLIISDYGAFREVSLSACYHTVSFSQTRFLFDDCMDRIDLPPARAELYLSELAAERLAGLFADNGVKLDSTLSASHDGNLAGLYETLTPVGFAQLQAILRRHARLIRSFARKDALAA